MVEKPVTNKCIGLFFGKFYVYSLSAKQKHSDSWTLQLSGNSISETNYRSAPIFVNTTANSQSHFFRISDFLLVFNTPIKAIHLY